MNWIVTLIIGGIVGWLASIIMKTNAQMGWIANIVIGIVGAVLGSWLAAQLGFAPAGAIAGYLVSIAGAAILIGILKMLRVLR